MNPVFIMLVISCVSLTSSLKCYSCGKNDIYNMETNEFQTMIQFCYPSDIGLYIDCPNGSCVTIKTPKEGTVFYSRACVSKKPTGCEKVGLDFVIWLCLLMMLTLFWYRKGELMFVIVMGMVVMEATWTEFPGLSVF